MRIAPRITAELQRLLHGQDRPRIVDVHERIGAFATRHRLETPSRATIYSFIARCPPHEYSIADLPAQVRNALYNLGSTGRVPGHQLAFYAFQYGELEAASFAAGLPWLDLFQAGRMRGWRPRSHGLLRSVLRARSIT